MKTELDFEIEELSFAELLHDMELYPGLKSKVRSSDVSREKRASRHEKLMTAELNTRIAILNSYYQNGLLEMAFGKHADERPDGFYVVDWGNCESRNFSCSRICRMLSELNVDRIASTEEMTNMYHDLTEIIDGARKKNTTFIIDTVFWETFFKFRELYFDPLLSEISSLFFDDDDDGLFDFDDDDDDDD